MRQDQDISLTGLLHEVAEGMQAASNYIAAARDTAPNGAPDPALVTKAADQLARATEAFQRARTTLERASSEPARQAPRVALGESSGLDLRRD
jgi:hypothetical protein